jgi:hypothetical protein
VLLRIPPAIIGRASIAALTDHAMMNGSPRLSSTPEPDPTASSSKRSPLIPPRMASRAVSHDTEKALAGPSPPYSPASPVSPSWTCGIPHGSLRRRRILGMAVSVMGLMTLGGWWTGAIPDFEQVLYGSELSGGFL